MRDVTALEQHQPARDGLHLERLLGSLTRGVPRPASEKALDRATVLRGRPATAETPIEATEMLIQ